jgi:hypothetical protein
MRSWCSDSCCATGTLLPHGWYDVTDQCGYSPCMQCHVTQQSLHLLCDWISNCISPLQLLSNTSLMVAASELSFSAPPPPPLLPASNLAACFAGCLFRAGGWRRHPITHWHPGTGKQVEAVHLCQYAQGRSSQLCFRSHMVSPHAARQGCSVLLLHLPHVRIAVCTAWCHNSQDLRLSGL